MQLSRLPFLRGSRAWRTVVQLLYCTVLHALHCVRGPRRQGDLHDTAARAGWQADGTAVEQQGRRPRLLSLVLYTGVPAAGLSRLLAATGAKK